MYENILFGIVTIDETISAFYIEPLDGARNFFSYIKNKNAKILVSKSSLIASIFLSLSLSISICLSHAFDSIKF